MSDNLMPYVRGDLRTPRHLRGRVEAAQEVLAPAFKAKLQIDAVLDLTTHGMAGAADLDADRRMHAQGDQALNMILSHMELKAVRKIERIIDGVYSPFGG